MAKNKTGSELFIVDNSDSDWKVLNYLREWTEISKQFDICTGDFEIGSLLALDGDWQKVEKIRILMGDEATKRTKQTLYAASLRAETRNIDRNSSKGGKIYKKWLPETDSGSRRCETGFKGMDGGFVKSSFDITNCDIRQRNNAVAKRDLIFAVPNCRRKV